jgi:KAP family P-loop domain
VRDGDEGVTAVSAFEAVRPGFWIFQARPERYDFVKGLEPGLREEWLVTSFAEEIREGDTVYLCRAESEEAIFGSAAVSSRVFIGNDDRKHVVLRYDRRYRRPITRAQLRRDPQLGGLKIFEMPEEANFRLTAAQAEALDQLIEPEMGGDQPTFDWARFSAAAQDVLGWAAASEAENRLGTRGLLMGLVRTSHPNEAHELLGFADVGPDRLFDALEEVRPQKGIDVRVKAPASLSSLPELTPNAKETIATAFRLQSDSAGLVEPRHIFGAILGNQRSRAYQALERVCVQRLPFDAICTSYSDYLAGRQEYRDFLRERFEHARPSTAITTDSWTDRDQLEHELYADAIARFILNEKTKAPLTIGIKAPWGAGKTSLMRMIRKRLDPQAPTKQPPAEGGTRLKIWELLRKTRARTSEEAADELEQGVSKQRTTIWFNAWKYQSSEQLWAGLAHAILWQVGERMSALDRDRLWASIHLRRGSVTEVRHGIYRYIGRRVVPYLIVVPVAAGGVLIAWAIDSRLLGGASVIGAIASVVVAGVALVRSASDEVTKANPQLVQEPDYESRLGFLHLVDSDMHRILEVAGATQDEPFVIFIDDLDRCSYTTVAQVIEALNVFLAGDFDNCIFIIAMEPDLVAAQIHVAYEKLFNRLADGGSDDLGWRFLEKMVQLPLALPEPGRPQVQRLLDSILLEAQVQLAEVPDDAPQVQSARKAIRDLSGTRSLEAIPEAMEQLREEARAEGTASPELEAVLQKAARLEFENDFSDDHARKMLLRYAGDLSGNPREIKRFVNVFRFYAYVDFWRRTQGFDTPGLEGAAKLARIAIGWPNMLNALAHQVTRDGMTLPLIAHLEQADGDDAVWIECVALAPERVRARLAALPELRAAIGKDPKVGACVAGFL